MLRHSLVLAALLASSLISANGCQSCSSCHDYDPPVANCNCGPHGQQGGCNGGCCNSGGCSSGGCSGCGCDHGTTSAGPYMSEAYSQEEQPVEATPEGEMAPANSR